jgi:hypothetical protein
MGDYVVGYGKPPRQHQFKKGVCPNKRGRGKQKPFEAGLIFARVMDFPTIITKRGRMENVSLKEFSVRRCAALAVKGDVGAADLVMEMLNHSLANGEFRPQTVYLSEAKCRALGITAKRMPKR